MFWYNFLVETVIPAFSKWQVWVFILIIVIIIIIIFGGGELIFFGFLIKEVNFINSYWCDFFGKKISNHFSSFLTINHSHLSFGLKGQVRQSRWFCWALCIQSTQRVKTHCSVFCLYLAMYYLSGASRHSHSFKVLEKRQL